MSKIQKYPYIGIKIANFLFGDKEYEYTCFLTDTNVIVILASYLIDKNKGEQIKTIITTYSKEK